MIIPFPVVHYCTHSASMLYTFIAIINSKIEFYVSVCWKATEQVIQVMQNYVRCLNLYQLTASQQNTDHAANMQVAAWEKSLNLNCCSIVFLKGRPCTISCLLDRGRQ